jgi:hypothetical protein
VSESGAKVAIPAVDPPNTSLRQSSSAGTELNVYRRCRRWTAPAEPAVDFGKGRGELLTVTAYVGME